MVSPHLRNLSCLLLPSEVTFSALLTATQHSSIDDNDALIDVHLRATPRHRKVNLAKGKRRSARCAFDGKRRSICLEAPTVATPDCSAHHAQLVDTTTTPSERSDAIYQKNLEYLTVSLFFKCLPGTCTMTRTAVAHPPPK